VIIALFYNMLTDMPEDKFIKFCHNKINLAKENDNVKKNKK